MLTIRPVTFEATHSFLGDLTPGMSKTMGCIYLTWIMFSAQVGERMDYSFELFFVLKLPSCLKLLKQVSNSSMYSFRVVKDWEEKSSF